MIDFDRCSIHALCHPARYYSQNLSSRLEGAVNEVAEEQALEADRYIQEEEYEKAIDLLDDMISRLEELEESVKEDYENAHKLTYVDVDNKSYHGKIVTAADEHGEDHCTLGALKAAKTDLEESPV